MCEFLLSIFPEIEPRSPTLQVDSLPSESPGKAKNTGVSSLSLLQGIFLTQELNQGLLHCKWILYQLSCKGRPKILDWVVYPFYSGSSWPRNWTRVSCIAGRFFANWANREVVVSRCKLLDIEWINNKILLYSTENYTQYTMINHSGKNIFKRELYVNNWITLLYQS